MLFMSFHLVEQLSKSLRIKINRCFFSYSFLFFITLSLILPYSLKAAVFYIDDRGVVHFVDDESLIPEKYKNRKRVIDREDSNIPTTPVERREILKKDEEEQPKDKFGNTPAYWRQRYKGLMDEKFKKERELRDLENQRDELSRRYESVRTRAFFVGDSQSVTESASLELRLRELENLIKMTISQLDDLNKKISFDIYNEVIQAGGRTEWLMSE